jgi:predicted lipoprotein with Yx(FWY)xxD motif
VNAKSRFLNSRLAAVGVVLAVLTVTATALASTTAVSQVKARKTSLGMILVNSKSHTLYLFEKDKSGKSACYTACAANWPPYLTTGKPTAGPGVKTSMLGTTKRTDGKLQVTYNHHPLYRFGYDTKAGTTKGENANAFGAHWFVVSPKGVKVAPSSSGGGGGYGGGPTGPTGSGGYGGGGYGGGGG